MADIDKSGKLNVNNDQPMNQKGRGHWDKKLHGQDAYGGGAGRVDENTMIGATGEERPNTLQQRKFKGHGPE